MSFDPARFLPKPEDTGGYAGSGMAAGGQRFGPAADSYAPGSGPTGADDYTLAAAPSSPFDIFKPIGNAIGDWFGQRQTPDQQAAQDKSIQSMYDAPVAGGLLRMFDPVFQTLKDPRAYLSPSGDAEQQAATRNAEGLFGLAGAGAVPPGVPEAALTRGSLGTAAEDASRIKMTDLAPREIVPGSMNDLGRAAFPEGAPVQNPAASGLRARMDLPAQPEPSVSAELWNDRFQNPTPENPYQPTSEPVRAPYNAPQLPANTLTTGLGPIEMRAPITAADLAPAAPAETGTLTPGRPYTFADLEARAGVKPGEPLFNSGERPMGIETKVRSGLDLTKLPNRAASDAIDAAAGRVPAGGDTSTAPSLYDQLAQSLRDRGRPDLIVGEDLKPVSPPPSSFVAANPAKLAIHDANEAVIQALRDHGPGPEVEAALKRVTDAGGDLNYTADRIRAAGLPGPTRSAIKAAQSGRITADQLATRIKGDEGGQVPPAAAAIPPVRGGLRDRLAAYNADDIGGGRLPFDKNTRYGTAAEVAAANDPRLAALTQSDPRLAAIGRGPITVADLKPNANPGRYVPTGGERPVDARVPEGVTRTLAGNDKLSLAENIATLPKSTTTLLSPEHAVGRHISSLLFSHPNATARGVGGGVSTVGQFLKNPAEARLTMAKLNDSMRRELDTRGLGVTEIKAPHGGPRSGSDLMPSILLNKVPLAGRVFEGTQAAFGQTQNIARFNAAKGEQNFLEWAKGRPLTQAEKDGAMERLNHFSGRGFRTETPEAQSARASASAGNPLDLSEKNAIASSNEKYKTAQMVGRVANIPMFSPQLRTSYVRMVGDLASAARNPTAAESLTTFRLAGGTLAAVGAYAAGAKALGLNLDVDPASSNFMKIDLGPKDQAKSVLALIASQLGAGMTSEDNGHVYLDATHGMASYIKTIAQTVKDVQTGKKNFDGSPAMGNPTGNLLKGMLSPGLYDANELRLGNQAKPAGAVLPMTVTGPIEAAGGKIGPTMQLAGAHVFKGQSPADIQIGPAPAKTAAPGKAPAKTTAPMIRALQTAKPKR